MRKLPLLIALIVCLTCAFAATPKSAKKAAAKKPVVTSKKKTTTKSAATSKKTGAGKKLASRKPVVPSWRSTQRLPTPERYKEIQQALASKGYLEPDAPNGVWDAPSVTALKKFQQEQNLDPNGKIDSLSLIALGLGPRRDPIPAFQP